MGFFFFMKFICDLPELRTLDGKALVPNKVVMHEEDSKVLMLGGGDSKKVFYMDLEKGKVVSELVKKLIIIFF